MKTLTPLHSNVVTPQSGCSYPEPFKTRMGDGSWRALGDAFELTQFGINLETLKPGAESALRHWHTLEDEFVYVLSGEVLLRTNDGDFPLSAGMCMGFKAGSDNAHHLLNRSEQAAQYLIMGSRIAGDLAFYPDDNLIWSFFAEGRVAAHKDGTAYPE